MRPHRLTLLLTLLTGCRTPGRTSDATPVYDAFAVRFGALANFRVRSLISGADSSRRLDATLMVWPLRAANGDLVMVDAGFTREKFITQWKPVDYVTPDAALRRAGFDPARVTDIIISHIHWDHADGVERFPNARVWLQREEFDYYVGPNGEAKAPAIDRDVAAMYRQLFTAGRIRLLDGDGAEVRPGIRVHTGGKHTMASQFVTARTRFGTVVIASDNAYLYENLDQRRPISQTLDSLSNLRAQATMKSLASPSSMVIPGHDPAVMARFPAAGDGAVALRPPS